MTTWGATFTHVQSTDPETQRRGRVLMIIALAMALLASLYLPVVLLTGRGPLTLALISVAAVLFLGVALLGRAGKVNLGAFILIGVTLAIVAFSIPNSPTPNMPFYMVLAVLLAGVLLPPIHTWTVLVCALLGIAAGFGLLPAELREAPQLRQGFMGAPLLLIMVALITYLSANGTYKALAAAQFARSEAEQASAALAASNTALEMRVEERTSALRRSMEEQQAAADQLQASLDAQQDLNRVIAELGVPVIPINARTMVVPLVGNIDSGRAEQLLGAILERVEVSGARMILLDVTGVAVVDSQVAAVLLRVAAATRLLGAETILVGIRPEVAQALVNLGVNLGTLRTAATLQDGLTLVNPEVQ